MTFEDTCLDTQVSSKRLFYSDAFPRALILKSAQWLRPLLTFETQITRKIMAPKTKPFEEAWVYSSSLANGHKCTYNAPH